jgi:hypothetical protein
VIEGIHLVALRHRLGTHPVEFIHRETPNEGSSAEGVGALFVKLVAAEFFYIRSALRPRRRRAQEEEGREDKPGSQG